MVLFLLLVWSCSVSGCSGMELFPNGSGEEDRPRAREVQKNRWEEVEVL